MNQEHLEILKKGVKAWNAWRKDNSLVKPILSGADLTGTNLRSADLSGANLSGADLSGADLSGADLSRIQLHNVILREANLTGAFIKEKDLLYAKKRGAITSEDLTTKELRQLQAENTAIRQLLRAHQSKLKEASQLSDADKKSAQDAIEKFEAELEHRDVRIMTLESELDRQRDELESGIQDAQKAIEESITETNVDIADYRKTSNALLFLGIGFYLITFLAAAYVGYHFGFDAPFKDDKWISQWVAIATPLVLLFSIGTALLRHDAKIRQRYQHLSDKKHTLEKASGVLKASSQLSQVEGLSDKHPLIAETFQQVRDSLLEVKPSDKDVESGSDSSEGRVFFDAVAKEIAKNAMSSK